MNTTETRLPKLNPHDLSTAIQGFIAPINPADEFSDQKPAWNSWEDCVSVDFEDLDIHDAIEYTKQV